MGMALGVGCVTDSAPESSASAAALAREPAFDLTGEAPWPPVYLADPVWQRAAGGGDFEQARLARREGASGLVAALSHGGSLGRAALASLPYASDRRAAQGPLCSLIARANAPSLGPLLAALLEMVLDAPHTEASLDPEADARCPGILEALAQRDSMTPAEQDRAAVSLSRLRAR